MWVLDQSAGGSVWKYVRVKMRFFGLFFVVFCGNGQSGNAAQGQVVILLGNILIRDEIEDGGRKAKVESCGLGKEVAWET